MRRTLPLLSIVLITAAALPVVPVSAQLFGRPQQQQQPAPQHRTLFDLLFGPRQPQEAPRQQVQQAPQQQSRPRRAVQPTPPPPAKPAVPKADNATRVLVIGDSLAVDLGEALQRLYSDDPNLVVSDKAIAASGFVRSDYYDWQAVMAKHIADNDFDVLVVMLGINDRQSIDQPNGLSLKPLTDDWITAYKAQLTSFMDEVRASGKPVIWVGLPPMQAPTYSAAISQISGIQRLVAIAGGADFIDIYDRLVDDNGDYTATGPDITGQQVRIRNSDGIHFTNAGSDKLAFYVGQALKLFHRGAVAVTDPLQGTDAATMLRPPYQGLGETRLLQVAGAVVSLTNNPARADQLVTATAAAPDNQSFSLDDLVKAPIGRADAFGVGYDPAKADKPASGAK